MNQQVRPHRTPVSPLREALLRWVSGTGRGYDLGQWLDRTIALPQLRRLTADPIPWHPLGRPLAEATVALVTTAGVHRRDDPPFVLASDSSFRVIPRTAEATDLAISHENYDRTDALRDINLVFPLQRLRELEAEGAIGGVAERHYGFGVVDHVATLVAPGRDAPGSIRDRVLFLTGEWLWRSWGALLYSVQTGQPAFDREFGMSNFAYWAHNPTAGAIHDAAFVQMARASTAPLLAAYDFSGFATIVDVGGSTGPLLGAILAAYPRARGILFDLPHVVAGAAPLLDAAGVADRCTTVGGSFFDAVPAGGDAYILKYILHDWDDARASAILRRCRAAMGTGAALLVIEHVLPDQLEAGSEAQRDARLDLQMLVLTPGGRERTEGEFHALLGDAGFALRRRVPTAAALQILDAVAV